MHLLGKEIILLREKFQIKLSLYVEYRLKKIIHCSISVPLELKGLMSKFLSKVLLIKA